MPHFLLDTNICIYIAKQRPPEVLARLGALMSGSVSMSVITFSELLFGANRSQHRQKALDTLEKLSLAIPVLPMDSDAGCHYGQIRAELQKQGTPIGNNDLWIAAHARSQGLVLVTNNEREFVRVPGLEVENWVLQSPQN